MYCLYVIKNIWKDFLDNYKSLQPSKRIKIFKLIYIDKNNIPIYIYICDNSTIIFIILCIAGSAASLLYYDTTMIAFFVHMYLILHSFSDFKTYNNYWSRQIICCTTRYFFTSIFNFNFSFVGNGVQRADTFCIILLSKSVVYYELLLTQRFAFLYKVNWIFYYKISCLGSMRWLDCSNALPTLCSNGYFLFAK